MVNENPVDQKLKLTKRVPKTVLKIVMAITAVILVLLLVFSSIVPIMDFKTGTKGKTSVFDMVFNHDCPKINQPMNWNMTKSLGASAISCSDQIYFGSFGI